MLLAVQLSGQAQVDVVRGRVTDDSSRAIVATVTVTRGPDRLVRRSATDSSGAFSVRFDPGTGDYLVFISAPGFSSARRRVQPQDGEHDLVANFILRPDLAALATVHVRAAAAVRAINKISPYSPETAASERWQDGVNGEIPPTLAGDLNAVAGTMSNITMSGAGPSILGSAAESNLTTLNGVAMAASSIPRAANIDTRVTGATFDVTRGGFSGANIDVELSRGNRLFQTRGGYLTMSPSILQSTDAAGRAAGAESSVIRGSLGADGELVRDALTYNVAFDMARNVSQPSTLLNAGGDAFLHAGVAQDSIARVRQIASPLGLALSPRGIPSLQQRDAFSWLGRLDDTRDTLATRTFTSYATYARDSGVGFAPLSAPSTAGEHTQAALGAQLTVGNYVGKNRMVLTETRLSASTTRSHGSPYEDVPGADVLILSSTLDSATDVGNVVLGGGQSFSADDSRWTIEGSNLTTWNTAGSRNHFKGLIWARADGLRQSGATNELGTFTFNSLVDLARGNANSYSRTLSQPERSGSVWNAAAALAHEWGPSSRFSVLYGARIDADGFASSPSSDPALENALGVRTDVAPSRIHISPRAGFSYTYSRERANGNFSNTSPVGKFYRGTTGVIHGGIGEFRDLLRPDLLANASTATGLANGSSRLSCVGAAVPAPDWTMFESNPSSIPSRCLDGSGILMDNAPAVSLISPSYDVPMSWRASLGWSTNIDRWLLQMDALGSYDLSQPGTVDANFAGSPRFTLSSEGSRPVFVSPAAIDVRSGVVSPSEARTSQQFGSVAMRTSDLRGYGGQLTTTIAPDVFRFDLQSDRSAFTSLSYTLQASRREYRGFDGAAFGDPRTIEWAPSNNDARHVFVYTFGLYTPQSGSITLFARAQSGLPFTPIVQGDVNGDGLSGDRAFIPNPALGTGTTLSNQLRSLMANGSSSARKCVLDNLGRVASRNGCRGPWTAMLNLQWSPRFPRRWLSRVTPNVYFENVLGGVDQLLHGSAGLRGWGGQPVVDPVLLVPTGFNPETKSFQYAVNSRFADTRPASTLIRNPFRVTLDFHVDLSTPFPLQQLRRAIEPVRGPNGKGWTRRTADSLTAFYLSRTSSIYKVLLEDSDTLFLTKTQTAVLQRDDSVYSARIRVVYRQLATFLAARGGADPGEAELDSATSTEKTYLKIFWEQPAIADSAITPIQRELVPILKGLLATRKPEQHHRFFGRSITVAGEPKSGST